VIIVRFQSVTTSARAVADPKSAAATTTMSVSFFISPPPM